MKKYYDMGYLVYHYAYRPYLWGSERGMYTKFAGSVLIGEGFKSIRKQLYPWYKANRKVSKQTPQQKEVREKAKFYWKEFEGIQYETIYHPLLEADDILALKALEGYTIVTNDKDLAQIPGTIEKLKGNLKDNLYAGLPKSLHHLEMTEDRYLLTLVIYGDEADNIPRLVPKGKKGIVDSLSVYESGDPWLLALDMYGEQLIDNLYVAVLPSPYVAINPLSKEEVFNLVKGSKYIEYITSTDRIV